MAAKKGQRSKLMRALHAEGRKRGLDHDDLRGVLGVESLADVETNRLAKVLATWTKDGGAAPSRRRRQPLPRRGYAKSGELEMVGSEDLDLLRRAFDQRELDEDGRAAFIRRQLHGRSEIRTRADFHKVFSGVRAMNRRKSDAEK